MKKILLSLTFICLMFVIVGCARRASEVVVVELKAWIPQAGYVLEETASTNITDTELEVTYDRGEPDSIKLSNPNVTLRGNGFIESNNEIYLDTTTVGEKNLRVSYSGVTIEVFFYVAHYIVSPNDDPVGEIPAVKVVIENAGLDEVVFVSAGDYFISSVITPSAEGVKIVGSSYGISKITSSAGNVFHIDHDRVIIRNLTLTTFNAPESGNRGMIAVVAGTDNVIIANNVIYSTYPLTTNYDDMWYFGIQYTGSGVGKTITIENNEIYNVRQGISIMNGSVVGIVRNNNIFHTKGGILAYLQTDDHVSNQLWTGNTWTSTVPGYRDHNEWDIVYHSAGWNPEDIDYVANLHLSELNNRAYILDSRAGNNNFEGTRTHVMIRDGGDAAYGEEASVSVLNRDSGNIRQAYWLNNRQESLLLAKQALTPGGTILEWDGETWIEVDPNEYIDS